MLQKVKITLRKIEALPIQERLHLQITSAILNLANPNPKQMNKLANKLNIPLLGFQTFDELVSYLEAVIRSGTRRRRMAPSSSWGTLDNTWC